MELHSLQSTRSLSSRLVSWLLAFQTLPDSFNNLMILAQIGAVIIFSDSTTRSLFQQTQELDSADVLLFSKELMLYQIIIILLLQLSFKVSFFRLTYLRYFAQFQSQLPISYGILILSIISLALDFIKSTTSLVIYQSSWAERYNQMKLLGYAINIASVVTPALKKPAVTLTVTILFLGYYLLRLKLPMINKETQFLMETMYLCGFSVSLFASLKLFNFQVSFYIKLGVITILFTTNYFLHTKYLGDNITHNLGDIEDIHRTKRFVKALNELTNYLLQYEFKEEDKKKLREFLERYGGKELETLSEKTKLSYFKALYRLAQKYKDTYSNNVEYDFILAQLEISANDNILALVKAIHEIQGKIGASVRTWIIRIEIFKLKELLEYKVQMYRFEHKKHEAEEALIKGFFENYSFIRTIINATNAYYSLWEGYVDGYPIVGDLEMKLDLLRVETTKVEETYEKIKKNKSKYSAWMYSYYLSLVSNDYERISSVKLDLEELKPQIPDFMPYPNTMFVCVTLEGHIIQVGENSYGLTGYQRQELEDREVLTIVPKFCHSRHRQWVQNYVNFVDNSKGIQSLIRWNKSSVLQDSRGYLRRMKVEFNLSLIDEEIRLAGGLKLFADVKQIIAFKESGAVIAVGQFHGECRTKNIGEERTQMKDTTTKLLKGEAAKIKVVIRDEVVISEYILIKMIPHQESKENIYIVEAIGSSFKECEDRNALTIAKKSQLAQKKFPQFLHLEEIEKEYHRKYDAWGLTWRALILFGFALIALALTGYVIYINNDRSQYQRNIANMLKAFEVSAVFIVDIAGKTLNLDMIINRGIFFPSLQRMSSTSVSGLLNTIAQSFIPLSQAPRSLVTQNFEGGTTFQTQSLLVTETIVTVFDYMLTFVENADFKNFAQYTAQNTETLIIVLLPFFQKEMIVFSKQRLNQFKTIHLFELIAIVVIVFIQVSATFCFHYHYKTQAVKVTNAILMIQNADLSDKIRKINSFRNMIFCLKGSIWESERFIGNRSFSFQGKSVDEKFLRAGERQPSISVLLASPSVGQSILGTERQIVEQSIYHYKAKSRESQLEVAYKTVKKPKIREKQPIKPNYILLGGLAILSISVFITIGLYFKLTQDPTSSVIKYLKSIIALKSTFYSYEIMFTSLILNMHQNYTKLDLLNQSIQKFSMSSNDLSGFEQTLFQTDDFQEFNEKKHNLDYNIICTYVNCPVYSNQLNLTYYNSILYSAKIISKIYDALRLNPSLPLQQLASSQQYQMDYLFHANTVYLQILNSTLSSAFDGLSKSIKTTQIKGTLLTDIQCLLFTLLGLVCAYEVWCFLNAVKRTKSVMRLVGGKTKWQQEGEEG